MTSIIENAKPEKPLSPLTRYVMGQRDDPEVLAAWREHSKLAMRRWRAKAKAQEGDPT
jgi:hypothetical protein